MMVVLVMTAMMMVVVIVVMHDDDDADADDAYANVNDGLLLMMADCWLLHSCCPSNANSVCVPNAKWEF